MYHPKIDHHAVGGATATALPVYDKLAANAWESVIRCTSRVLITIDNKFRFDIIFLSHSVRFIKSSEAEVFIYFFCVVFCWAPGPLIVKHSLHRHVESACGLKNSLNFISGR